MNNLCKLKSDVTNYWFKKCTFGCLGDGATDDFVALNPSILEYFISTDGCYVVRMYDQDTLTCFKYDYEDFNSLFEIVTKDKLN